MAKQEKLLIGPRLRRLRTSLGLTQARMAQDLGISTSYMNLMERNQRAMSANVLVKMADLYDFNVAEFTGAGDAHLVAEVYDVLRDPLFKTMSVSKNEAEDIVGASPDTARALLHVYQKHKELSLRAGNMAADRDKVEMLGESSEAVESVRRFIHQKRNYFPELDKQAEMLATELQTHKNEPQASLTDRLRDKHGIRVRIVPIDIMPRMLRYYDQHAKRINLSELLRRSGRRFQLAFQIGLLEHRDLIDSIIKDAKLPGPEAQGLARTSLSNYFAAATLMPYSRFLKDAETTRYDLDLLASRYGTSFEQVAHRLTTLQKPDARGIPFFFVRIDVAGNVSKRFSAGRFHFSALGGACPLWNIHACFQDPGRIHSQIIQLPDDTTYFSIAKMVSRSGSTHDQPAQKLAIGLGCDIAYAPRLAYAKQYNLEAPQPTPIGINCYVCERQNCRQRAHAPIGKTLQFDERARGMSLFSFGE